MDLGVGYHKSSNDNVTIIHKVGVPYFNKVNIKTLLHFINKAPSKMVIIRGYVNMALKPWSIKKIYQFGHRISSLGNLPIQTVQ
jgi:hypothetical protein